MEFGFLWQTRQPALLFSFSFPSMYAFLEQIVWGPRNRMCKLWFATSGSSESNQEARLRQQETKIQGIQRCGGQVYRVLMAQRGRWECLSMTFYISSPNWGWFFLFVCFETCLTWEIGMGWNSVLITLKPLLSSSLLLAVLYITFCPVSLFFRHIFLLRTARFPRTRLSLWLAPAWRKNSSAAVSSSFSCLRSSVCGRKRRKGISMSSLNCRTRNSSCCRAWRNWLWDLVPNLCPRAAPTTPRGAARHSVVPRPSWRLPSRCGTRTAPPKTLSPGCKLSGRIIWAWTSTKWRTRGQGLGSSSVQRPCFATSGTTWTFQW